MSQKYCACHTKPLSTRYKTRLHVTKCHACHAKRNNEKFETSKNDHLCRTYHRHGHMVLTRTVADGCGRLRTVANGCERLQTVADGCGRSRTYTQRRANTPSTPNPQSETGTLATHSGIKYDVIIVNQKAWALDKKQNMRRSQNSTEESTA